MRLLSRTALIGIALVATVLLLVGCGGGSNRPNHDLAALRRATCEVFGIERQLRALRSGIAATRKEFDASDPGPAGRQILRSMEENVDLIRRQLPSLEHCPQDALRADGGRSADEPSALPTPRTIAVAHRLGPPRIEPGEQVQPASPCSPYGKDGATTVYVYPDSPGCARVTPSERLRVANLTGIGLPADEAVSVRVRVGDYEMWLGPGQEGVVPAPIDTYYGRGAHSVGAVGGLGPTVLVLPDHCAIRPPAKPGEELCFR